MQFLITRPLSVSKTLAAKLEAEGHTVISSPLLEIRPFANKHLDLAGVQGLIVTSINGMDNLLSSVQDRSLPVYCVGDKTAQAAVLGGFETVKSADGNVEDLAHLIQGTVDPAQGTLLHVGGKRLAGDLKGMLEQAGFSYHREILYDAAKVEGFTQEALDAFRHGKLQGVLLFSPYTAEVFSEIVGSADLRSQLAQMDAWCLSENVADKIDTLGFHGIHIADQPKEQSLLDLINEKVGQKTRMHGDREKGTREHIVSDKLNTGDQKPTSKEGAAKPASGSKATSKPAVPASETSKSSSGSAQQSRANTASSKPASGTGGSASSPKGPAPAKKSGQSKLLWTGLAVFFIFCLGMAAWPILYPSVSGYLPEETQALLSGGQSGISDREQALANRVAELEEKMVSLQSGGDMSLPEDITATLAEVPALKMEVENLKSRSSEAPDALNNRLADLEAAQQDLSAAVKGMQDNIAAISPLRPAEGSDSAAIAPAEAELMAIRSALENLSGEIRAVKEDQAASSTDVESQKSQLETLSAALRETVKDTQSSQVNSGDALALLALGQLQRKSQTAQPFDGAWQQAMAVLPEQLQPDLRQLSDVAQKGAPTYRELTDSFGLLATDAVQASRLPDSETWYGKTLHNLASLVKFRRVDGALDDSVDAKVASAEAALLDGDLGSAVSAVEGLDGEPAKVMAPWLAGAKSRLLIDTSLANLISKASTDALDKSSSEN